MRTIRAKIIFIIVAFLLAISVVFWLYVVNTTDNYQALRIDDIKLNVHYGGEKVNTLIAKLEQSAADLAVAGALYQQHHPQDAELGEQIVLNRLRNFPLPVGGGVWYEPHKFEQAKKYAAIYAFRAEKNNLQIDREHAAREYNHYPNETWYRELKHEIITGKKLVGWTSPYRDETGTFSLMITVGAGIFDEQDNFIGVSSLDWLLDDVIAELTKIKPTKNSCMIFFAPQNNYIIANTCATTDVTPLNKSARDQKLIKNLFTKPRDDKDLFRDYLEIDGVYYLAFSKYLHNSLALTIAIPEDEIFADIQQRNRIFVVLFSVASLSVLVIALYAVAKFINRPIRQLIDDVCAIGAGNLNAQVRVMNDDELGLLGTTFNRMTAQLKGEITEHARINAEKEQAESNIRMRTEFFARMSHEIRTPMNAIIGFSQVLQQRKLAADDQDLVTHIIDSSQILLLLINDILDLAKIDSQKLVLVPEHYDLHQLLTHLSAMSTTLTKSKPVTFRCERAENLPTYLFGDDIRLKQVLLNLLSNAVKFTEQGEVALTVRVENGTLIFAISDTGMGIKQDDIASLFDIFHQVNLGKTRAILGTGLGLAISQQLVKLMNGDIRIKSVYGKGTTFTVIIPLILGDEKLAAGAVRITENSPLFAEKSATPPTKRSKAAAQILVVDDNQMNLLVATQLLGMAGVQAEQVASGKAAIEAVQKKDYDLIFMDHMMPEMDGVETLHNIRALGGKYQQIPIIALTANAVGNAREEFLTHGFNEFISKPLDLTTLRKLIDGYFA